MRHLHPLERALLSALRGPCGVRAGEKGLLAVSGGPDSLALLQGLIALRERLPLRLEVVHFDHGLRPESAREAAWVAVRARAAGLPLHVRRTESLRSIGGGVQAAARAWRREELLRLQAATQADWIATGHQRDDHLETLLLKLLRGVHLSRLRGMESRSGPFIRPLLGMARTDLLAYLRGGGHDWLEDPSNLSGKYRRNRVRHELLPLLNDLAGGAIAARLEALERQSRQLAAWLEALPVPRQSAPGAGSSWLDVASLQRLPPLARGHALVAFVQRHVPGELSAENVERALALLQARGGAQAQAWALHLPGGRTLRRRGARVLLDERRPAPSVRTVRLDDVTVRVSAGWTVTGGRSGSGARLPLTLAHIAPGATLEVRLRQPGDRFHPLWRTHAVKVKDFLRDQGVPLWERDHLPLLVLEGRVVAIYPRFVARDFTPHAEGRPNGLPVLTLQLEKTGRGPGAQADTAPPRHAQRSTRGAQPARTDRHGKRVSRRRKLG